MEKIKAQEGYWLTREGVFVKTVDIYGEMVEWTEVTDEYKRQWEEEHPNTIIQEEQ